MPETPYLRLVVDNDAEDEAFFAHSMDTILRLRAVAPDASGDAIWVLLDPEPEPAPARA